MDYWVYHRHRESIIFSWWRHQMKTFSALLAICAGNSLASGEFPTQRSVTRRFDVFFDMCLNKWLRKQSWGWWFETLSWPLWCHCDVARDLKSAIYLQQNIMTKGNELILTIMNNVYGSYECYHRFVSHWTANIGLFHPAKRIKLLFDINGVLSVDLQVTYQWILLNSHYHIRVNVVNIAYPIKKSFGTTRAVTKFWVVLFLQLPTSLDVSVPGTFLWIVS